MWSGFKREFTSRNLQPKHHHPGFLLAGQCLQASYTQATLGETVPADTVSDTYVKMTKSGSTTLLVFLEALEYVLLKPARDRFPAHLKLLVLLDGPTVHGVSKDGAIFIPLLELLIKYNACCLTLPHNPSCSLQPNDVLVCFDRLHPSCLPEYMYTCTTTNSRVHFRCSGFSSCSCDSFWTGWRLWTTTPA